jgi:hypothetical protein
MNRSDTPIPNNRMTPKEGSHSPYFIPYTCYDEAMLATVGSCLLAGMLFSSVDSLQYIFFFLLKWDSVRALVVHAGDIAIVSDIKVVSKCRSFSLLYPCSETCS